MDFAQCDRPPMNPAYLADARAIDSFWTVYWCAETDCSQTASIYCMQTSAN